MGLKTIMAATTVLLAASIEPQTFYAQNKSIAMTSPLLQRSTLQYQAPRFDLIKEEHFKPAFEYSLKYTTKKLKKNR